MCVTRLLRQNYSEMLFPVSKENELFSEKGFFCEIEDVFFKFCRFFPLPKSELSYEGKKAAPASCFSGY